MKTWMSVMVLMVMGSAGMAIPLRAQVPDPVKDSRIKVVLEDGGEIQGDFQSWTGESLSIIAPGSRLDLGGRLRRAWILEKKEVREVWLKTGERAATGRRLGQALKLTALGALIGAGVGYLAWDGDSDSLIRREGYAGIFAVMFATPVAVGGLFWAVLGKDDVWTRTTPVWERSGGKAGSDWTQELIWSAGVTPNGQLALGLTLQR